MSDKSTFTGKNIEAALAKAAAATGQAADSLTYEVLAGKTGGFALIKLTGVGAKPQSPLVEKISGEDPPPGSGGGDDDRDRDRGDRGDRGGRDRDRGDRGGRGGGRDRGDRGARGERGGRGDRDRGGRGGRDRGDRGGDRGGRGGRDRGRRREDPVLVVPEDGPTEVTVSVVGEENDAVLAAVEVVETILTKMGFGMSATVEETDDNLRVNLTSGVYHDAMVANELELLDALEHLVDKIVSDEVEDAKRVIVDSEGIKAKADEDLGASARELANRAIEQAQTFKMGPLDPRSRRIVHMTLKDVDGVTTRSEGEGVFRRVCIIPEKDGAEA
ncbi:MAG: hypothetical protein H6745_18545 [Deltaproteobacteria bacterium]|nr:hypothetical protein [Deltaproteobacteria bacterium]